MDYFDTQLLAGAALGLTEEQTDDIINDDEDFDSPLLEKFGVDLEQFGAIAEALLPLTPTVQSPLTGTVSHAFVRQLGGGNCLAIVKMDAKEQPKKEDSTC
ncbi:hypothetical protein ACWAOL_004510 [Vibrio parahaemolyticus]|uniref:hypothetical protein n=1 Tax=Shewanella algae TaxID=38313 RepID=UPI001D28E986|nr:hypothetical protein [Salmonella enterica]EHM1247564.1 hypothetical protein [Salmonella enterica]